MRQFLDVIIDQSDIRRIYGDITSHAAHGNADMGFFQGRSIVDAISDHADHFLIFLGRGYIIQFIFRETACVYVVNIQLSGDGPGGIFVISCHKYRGKPQLL